MIPRAVADALEVRDGAPIGARNARREQCPRCHAVTLAGLDEDLLAFAARADLTPIDAAVELACVIAKRRTYELAYATSGKRRRLRLTRRGRWDYSRRRADRDVVPAHQCGQPLPAIDTRLDR